MNVVDNIQIFELFTVVFFAGVTYSKINTINRRLDKFDNVPERLTKLETEVKNLQYEKK